MTSATSQDDSATVDTAPAVSVETNDIYDLRVDDGDDRSASTYGRTILSSAPPSSREQSRHNERIHVPIGSLSLSLNPSMVDSSVLAPETSSCEHWLGLHSGSLPSSLSCSDISSISSAASHSTPTFVFANIGRSLALASAASDTDGSDSESEGYVPSKSPEVTNPVKGVKWWDQLRTEEDWDRFRARANEHLSALVDEEMRDMMKRNERSVDKGRMPVVDEGGVPQEGFFGTWLKGLLHALTATTPPSIPSSPKAAQMTLLIKEVAEIKQQLEKLPPIPPTLPEDLPLDDLPTESREMLVQYRDRLDAWRGESMPQQEQLLAKYARCQERLLAAIIDSEEDIFYRHNHGTEGSSFNVLGAVNGDGYVEVVERKSPHWNDVDNTLLMRQSKCQMSLRAALIAALTAGAGFFVALQSKRR